MRQTTPRLTKIGEAPARLAAAQLRPKKAWGQHFLEDPAVHAQLLAALHGVPHAQPVLELGAGLGALTAQLLQAGWRVIGVERDRQLVPLLAQRFAAQTQFSLLEADAARLDYGALAQRYGAPLTVMGNLPYHLSGRIVVALAAAVEVVSRSVLLLQLEVAQRLCAAPGRHNSLLSILLQRAFAVQLVAQVPPTAFYPPPRVHSAIVVLRALPTPRLPGADDAALVWTARAAFAMRRKTLTSSLAQACHTSKAAMAAQLRALHIAPQARPESLGVAQFAQLGCALRQQGCLPGAS